jgi:hypothetical protein
VTVFAVVRHPDIETLGVCPEAALEGHRALGWIRVSPWAAAPADLHLAEYVESYVDLDASEKPASPVAPAKDERQAS